MSGFEGKSVLVVGGAGFVGSNLVRQVLEQDPKLVLIVDNLLSADRSNVPDHPAVTFLERSINDAEALDAIPSDLDYAFHLATYHGNQSSIADPLADHENNTLTTLKLCERLKDVSGLTKLVYAGAGCTVAEKTFEEAHATQEDAPVSLYLDSPYQISKIIGELYCNYYFHQYELPAVKARFQNVYGPGEILGAGAWRGTPATIWRNVTPAFMFRGIKGQPLTVENGGIATRDFIYVDDIARGLIACALQGEPGGVYNLASGEETSILELAERINAVTHNEAEMDFRPARSWDRSGKRFGSTEKAARELDFRADTGLEQGLEQMHSWMTSNLDTIERCIGQHKHRVPEVDWL